MTAIQVKALVKALKQRFGGKVESERVGANGRYRFAVTSRKFETMPHLARQDAAWKVVDAVLPREAKLDVSLILTFAPSDLTVAK
jgi:hypothetical protein